MQIVRQSKFLCLCVVLAASDLCAQSVTGVQVFLVASDGNETTAVKGSEGELVSLGKNLRTAFGGRVKNELILPLSRPGPVSVLQQLSTAFFASDSTDVMISAWMGPWNAGSGKPTSAGFLNQSEQKLTVDYLLNLIQLIPARTSFTFILAPGKYGFPPSVLKEYGRSAASGGKHLILVGAMERMSYDNMVEAFVDAVENMGQWNVLDLNKDGRVSAGEWLIGLEKRAKEEKIAITPYWLERGTDVQLFQILR